MQISSSSLHLLRDIRLSKLPNTNDYSQQLGGTSPSGALRKWIEEGRKLQEPQIIEIIKHLQKEHDYESSDISMLRGYIQLAAKLVNISENKLSLPEHRRSHPVYSAIVNKLEQLIIAGS